MFIRGTHENCARAGRLFFKVLAPETTELPCADWPPRPPYVNFFGSNIIKVIDTSQVSDSLNPVQVPLVASQFRELK
ncbi:MAG: hypothetical protein ACK55I_22095, partial [bacterium]